MKKKVFVLLCVTAMATLCGCGIEKTETQNVDQTQALAETLDPSVEAKIDSIVDSEVESMSESLETVTESVNAAIEEEKEMMGISKKAYTNEDLVRMAGKHADEVNEGYIPSIIEVESEEGDIVTIHLYDVVDDGEGVSHTSTNDWYYIDRTTGKGTNLVGDDVDLTPYQ